jgi:hypothetical protein
MFSASISDFQMQPIWLLTTDGAVALSGKLIILRVCVMPLCCRFWIPGLFVRGLVSFNLSFWISGLLFPGAYKPYSILNEKRVFAYFKFECKRTNG